MPRRPSSVSPLGRARFGLSLLSAAYLLLSSGVAFGSAGDRSGFSLSLGAGYRSFVQEGHAPPICCGERDEWTAHGAQLGLRPGWFIGQHLELYAELLGSFVRADAEGMGHRIWLTSATVGAGFLVSDGVPLYVHVGMGFARAAGDFGHEVALREVEKEQIGAWLLGTQLGLSYELVRFEQSKLRLGLEATYTQYWIVQHGIYFGVFARWHGIGSS